jgi:hypothetical protein
MYAMRYIVYNILTNRIVSKEDYLNDAKEEMKKNPKERVIYKLVN